MENRRVQQVSTYVSMFHTKVDREREGTSGVPDRQSAEKDRQSNV